MPAMTTEAPKAQPWKAHWPPKDALVTPIGQYLVSSTGDLIVDGFGVGVVVILAGASPTRFSELACSAKEPSTANEGPKAQPWKAHWSPKENASRAADKEYLVNSAGESVVDGAGSDAGGQYIASSTGNVIVDGEVQGGSPDLLSELVCSKKEEKN